MESLKINQFLSIVKQKLLLKEKTKKVKNLEVIHLKNLRKNLNLLINLVVNLQINPEVNQKINLKRNNKKVLKKIDKI